MGMIIDSQFLVIPSLMPEMSTSPNQSPSTEKNKPIDDGDDDNDSSYHMYNASMCQALFWVLDINRINVLSSPVSKVLNIASIL
jgi:hypothetical protein